MFEPDTKNHERRDIPTAETVKATLQAIEPRGKLVFPKRNGKPFDKTFLHLAFRKTVEKSGIKDFHFHDLRHTFASILVMQEGGELNEVRELLGHKHMSMTLRYPHLSPKHKKRAERFAYYVGKRRSTSTLKDVARELHLNHKTVNALEKQYMREKLRRAGNPRPKKIGIDVISIRKGHSYRIVVADLKRRWPIWFGGKNMELVVKDSSLRGMFPRSVFRGFPHVHDCEPYPFDFLWVRAIHKRASGSPQNGRSYVLKEQFSQLWDYQSEAWARKFFNNWKASLKWQRLKPYEKFAEMIERHWDGIAAFCKSENKVSLGLVEGLNNKIRVIQRRILWPQG